MLVCAGPPPPTHYEESPCLLAEVVSETTEGMDRREKPWRYLRLPSLQGYLLVDSRHPRVEVYFRGPEGWLYRAHGPEFGERAEVPCLGVGVYLGEIYEGAEPEAASFYFKEELPRSPPHTVSGRRQRPANWLPRKTLYLWGKK